MRRQRIAEPSELPPDPSATTSTLASATPAGSETQPSSAPVTAANLSYGTNDAASAQSDMAMAASQAMARGDVEKAAQAYADAAWLANERKQPEQARTFAKQAEVLASSPLLSGPQRNGILRRFVHTGPTGPELAAQATR